MVDLTRPVRVVVADDQAPFRSAARAVVERIPGFELVGEAAGGEEAIALVASLEPDVVLMDITMPGTDGIAATRRIARLLPATTVVLVSTYRVEDLPADALTCGAAEYLHKENVGSETLLQFWRRRTQEPRSAR